MNTTPRASITDRLADRPAIPPKSVTGTDTCVIGCKIGPGLTISRYVLQDVMEVNPSGPPRSVRQWREVEGSQFHIRGPNSSLPAGMPARAGEYPMLVTSGGYALTTVPKDLWDGWYEANKASDMIRRRLVYCASDESRGRDEGRELAENRSGLEPIAVPAAGQKISDPRIERTRLAPMTLDRRG